MVGGQLQGVDDAQDLVEVATGRHGVDQHQLDLLVGGDHEDVAQRRVLGGGAGGRVAVDIGGEDPVGLADRVVGVGDDGVVDAGALGRGDVLRPVGAALHRVGRDGDDLDAAA